MPLLRKITRPKWLNPGWMHGGEVQADALVDLRTTNNELSVWHIEPDSSNLDAIIVALASSLERLDKVDYVIVEDEVVARLGIRLEKTDGDSKHADANGRWHRDLVELTVAKIHALAVEVKLRESEHHRVLPPRVRELLKRAVAVGDIDVETLKPALRGDVQ